MLVESTACPWCGVITFGEVVYHGLYLKIHCPECTTFIKNAHFEDVDDFEMPFGKYEGKLISNVALTEIGLEYLRWLFNNSNSLKDWQRYVINLYL